MSGYFDASTNRISDGLTARASDVNTLRDEVGAGFDLLPDVADLNAGTTNYAVDTGTTNAYVVALPQTAASYTDGLHVVMRPINTNTGASTINVDGLGVKSIRGADSLAIAAGDILVGVPTELRYSTATGFFHLAPASAAAARAAAAAASAAAALSSQSAAATSETNAASSASTATTQAGIATAKAVLTAADAVATAADRVQTGLDASTATTQASSASTSAGTATTQAGISTTQAGIATTKASEASASAAAAAASAATVVAVEVATHAAASKTPPVDGDEIPLVDSAASNGLKKLTWANLKATLIATAMTWTGAQTFRAANSVRAEAASTQDAIVLAGRAGGTSSYAATLTPATLTANRTLTLPDATDTLIGKATTDTLTNKRFTPRVGSTTSSATPTINTDDVDIYKLTAQTEAITSFTTNLSGTPTDGQVLIIQITGTAARAITWGASFEASTVSLPTTTVTTNMLSVGFLWNTATSKWRCVASV